MKKIFSFMLVFTILISISLSAFAYTDTGYYKEVEYIQEVLSGFEKEYIYNEQEIKLEIPMDEIDKSTLLAIAEHIETYGIESLNEEVQEQIDKVFSEIKTNQNVEVKEQRLPSITSNGRKYVEDYKYELVKFEKNYAIEYIAVLGMSLIIEDNKIERVESTAFDTKSMSVGGSHSNARTSSYVRSDGMNAGMTVNYDVSKTVLIEIGVIPIPFVYTTNKVNSFIYWI